LETQSRNNGEGQELPVLKKGIFYSIRDGGTDLIMEDSTKRGLTVQETSVDEKYHVRSERGMIYDMDGIGHRVGIRWFFPKGKYPFEAVLAYATEMEERYRKIRQETCPDY